MDTTHWADLVVNFKIQDAACLMAGVSPPKELVAWADQLPPEARYIFERLWNAYMQGVGVYEQPALDSPDFPKMLHATNFLAPISVPARGAIHRAEMLVPPSAELMRKRLERVRVSREELHRWVQAMGITSAYDFAPQGTKSRTVRAKVLPTGEAFDMKPWLLIDPNDPAPIQPWYTSARYFARQLVKDDSTLLLKRIVLADKVSRSMSAVGIYKRGGKSALGVNTVLKAFANVVMG